MGVCFVGEVGMKDFLKEYIDIRPGEIREIESGKVLGYHEGAVFYTIGQRHGLYLDGEKGVVNDGMPYYVVKKDIDENVVYVSKNLNDENIWCKELTLRDVIWRLRNGLLGDGSLAPVVTGRAPSISTKGRPLGVASTRETSFSSARLLQRSAVPPISPQKATSQSLETPVKVLVRLRHRAPLIPASFDGKKLVFESEIRRPASGQSAVLYDGEVCLGGGIIE